MMWSRSPAASSQPETWLRRGTVCMVVVGVLLMTASAWRFTTDSRSASFLLNGSDSSDAGSLYVIFSAADCVSHADFIEQWHVLQYGSPAIRVVGVPLRLPEDSSEAVRELGGFRTGYPLRPDMEREATRAMLALGRRTTPLAILVDRDGNPRMVTEPLASQRSQAELTRIIADFVQTTFTPARSRDND